MYHPPIPNKERILPTEDGYTVRYGADKEEGDPSVLYLKTKARVTPTVKENDYVSQVSTVVRNFSRRVRNTVKHHNSLSDTCIFTMDLSPSSVEWGKKSFLRYEVFTKPEERRPMDEYEGLFLELARQIDADLDGMLEAQGLSRC
ncbi:MAG: hypothetical protein LUD72_00995 [Bacteroidales bacterium]|nr:hypothetical protein [Bacteroidales bacterium]